MSRASITDRRTARTGASGFLLVSGVVS